MIVKRVRIHGEGRPLFVSGTAAGGLLWDFGDRQIELPREDAVQLIDRTLPVDAALASKLASVLPPEGLGDDV